MLFKKPTLIIFLFLFILSPLPVTAATPKDFNDKFVGVNSIRLLDNFTTENIDIGTSYLASECGISIIRLFLPYTDYPELTNLKYALKKGAEYGIKFIITLGDSFLLPETHSLNFYHNDLETYKQRARNTINELKNDYGSAIFAWELLNEPHCDYGPIKTNADGTTTREVDPTCFKRLYNFVKEFSNEIKQLDPTHPVTIGLLGRHGDNRTSVWSQFEPKTGPYAGSDFVALNNIDTIDAAESHFYNVSMETIKKNIDKANHINKPFFVEEYGPDGIKKSRADQLKEKMRGSFDYGAKGFLVWEYTPVGNGGDDFHFNKEHHNSLCNVLREEAAREDTATLQNALPEPYTLGPLDPSYYFTPPPNCNLEIMDFDDVHIQQVLSGQPTEEAIHPRNQHPNYMANTNHDKFSLVCTTTAEIEQTFAPISSSSNNHQEYVVTQIKQRLKKDQYSSDLGKKLEMQFSETSNPFYPQIMETAFTSYKNPISAFFRMWPHDQQNEYKLQRLENVALVSVQDTISLDTQLAWRCGQKCFTLNCGKPEESCQPVRLSELAYYYRKKLSPNARTSLHSQYLHTKLLPSSCYHNMFRFLNPTTPGSLAGQITVQQSGQTLTEKRGLPRTAILADPIAQNIQNLAISADKQQTSSEICRFVKTPPTGDTTNIGPVTFSATINQEVIRDKARTFSQSISITNNLDNRLEEGIGTHQNFLKQIIPAETIKQITQESDQADSTVNQEQFVQFTDPGNPSLSNIFTDYLHSASWQ